MKITFLTPLHKISGGVRVILTYADLLAKKGHEVTVVAQSRKWWRRNIANFLHLKPNWMRSLRAKARRVASYQKSEMPAGDIVVISNWRDAYLTSQYSEKIGAKFYLVQHDERMYHGPANEVDKAFRLPFKKIVVSSWLKEMLKKDYAQESELLLNTVDFSLFHPVKIKKDESAIRILILDHTYEWKGTKEGVRIARELKQKYPDVRLILFGARKEKIDFSCDEYYYNLPQEKLAWLYSSCDIFLCSSWDEGFGLPSLEAMACGCALVTYDNGGSRDFAYDGQTALVAKRRDINELSKKLEILVADKNLRQKIAKNGYDFVQKMPTWEEQTEKLEKIFKESLNNA